MKMRRGRCTNVEFCELATSQRIVEIPEDEPFICPKCSSDLTLVASRAAGGISRLALVQAAVIVLGAAGIGYKLFLRSGPSSDISHPVSSAPARSQPVAAHAGTAGEKPLAQADPKVLATGSVPAAAAPAAPSMPPAMTVQTPAVAEPAIAPFLHLAGSDVITNRLARRLAAGYLALIGDTDIRTETGTLPNTVNIAGSQAGQVERISIASTSSSRGFNALLRGQADIALSIRPVTPTEVENLAPLGDMTSADAEHVAGVEAVSVIVNPGVRVDSISKTQLRAILKGTIRNWSEFGLPGREIHVYLADDRHGERDTAASVLLDDPTQAVAAHLLGNEAAVVSAVTHDAGGIGLVDSSASANSRVLAVSDSGAPLLPSDIEVATEDYPLTRRVYFYGSNSASNAFVRRFMDYVTSTAGQAAVEASGFVSLTVKAQASSDAATAGSQRFSAFIAGTTRLSTTLRFQPGSVLLDSKGQHDVERLAIYLRSHHVSAAQVLIAGFADNVGTPAGNEAVAQKRVKAAVEALSRAGIVPGQVASFGADMPVADNATAEGREKNRRVEIFVKL